MSVVGPVRWVVRTDMLVIEATVAFCNPEANASSDSSRTGGGSEATLTPIVTNPPKWPTTATTARIRATPNRGLTHLSGPSARALACPTTMAVAAPKTKLTKTVAYSARCRSAAPPARPGDRPGDVGDELLAGQEREPVHKSGRPPRRHQLGMCRAV